MNPLIEDNTTKKGEVDFSTSPFYYLIIYGLLVNLNSVKSSM